MIKLLKTFEVVATSIFFTKISDTQNKIALTVTYHIHKVCAIFSGSYFCGDYI